MVKTILVELEYIGGGIKGTIKITLCRDQLQENSIDRDKYNPNRKAKIGWESVCKPKVEGGLGIKPLESWNIALMSKHIWPQKESLWVKRVNTYKLKGRNFWDVPYKGASWGWKKILKHRALFRNHIIHKIGNGSDTSLWFDNWNAICPLSDYISKRNIYSAGLRLDCEVSDVIVDGKWCWPDELSKSFDALSLIPPPVLDPEIKDKVVWRNRCGRNGCFSVSEVWNDIRDYGGLVAWSKLIWFSQCIPRHSFMVWLAVHGRLKTHDTMKTWESNDNKVCAFCNNVPDSHNHLFFSCEFPKKIWNRMKCLVRLDHAPNKWQDLVIFMTFRPVNKSIWSILQRLVLGACVYYIWQERNLRIFQRKSRALEDVFNHIKDVVRLRIMSPNVNASFQVHEAAAIWKFSVQKSNSKGKVKFVNGRNKNSNRICDPMDIANGSDVVILVWRTDMDFAWNYGTEIFWLYFHSKWSYHSGLSFMVSGIGLWCYVYCEDSFKKCFLLWKLCIWYMEHNECLQYGYPERKGCLGNGVDSWYNGYVISFLPWAQLSTNDNKLGKSLKIWNDLLG
ncbi:RNA-directed DNA polymerase, eukaryota, reverse transcriptase zinc-binding domain protein [Tanacetum coccineum]